MTDVHVINHTHWDREWFLTHEYTTAWVPPLIDSLEKLAAANTNYEFLLDGQTLAIEDLLKLRPDYRERVQALVSGGQLEIGPCYSQPDWRMVSGELHLRNLIHGVSDAESLGGDPRVAWLVDTFGHISQAPQMLALAGMKSAYVWRGVPEMVPVFRWRGADGTELPTVDLFGGYRNLYGVTKTPDIAVDRLVAESDKLAASYAGLPVPLFDGYDLDTEPEDPAIYYEQLAVPGRINLHASSPTKYADAVAEHAKTAPIIEGELLSGKYGSTFPGSLSSRVYLKVLHHDAETALHRRIEPLAVLASAAGSTYDAGRYERANRELLQNGVHDCLCGVSIDQVHERMERSYRRLLSRANDEQSLLSQKLLGHFAPGLYAISTNSIAMTSVVRAGSIAAVTKTSGIGVTPAQSVPVSPVDAPVERFDWTNGHYTAAVDSDGITIDGCGRIVRLVVRHDTGDTYSSEPGDIIGELVMTGPPVHIDETMLNEAPLDATVRTEWQLDQSDVLVSAIVDVRFDQGPTVDINVELDSTGSGFRVDCEFETSVAAPTVHAGMPFDIVERPHADTDLLAHKIDDALAAILMGQRETGLVTEYPFHNLVAISGPASTRAVHAQGLRSYRSHDDGVISIALRRAVEWLALTDLQFRSGDAGPAMYVPGARSERVVQHRLAFSVLAAPVRSVTGWPELLRLNEAFQNPPIIATVEHADALAVNAPNKWNVLTADAVVAGMSMVDGRPVVRLYNPTDAQQDLADQLPRRTLRGHDDGTIESLRPKEIVTVGLSIGELDRGPSGAEVTVLTPIIDRAGRSRSTPDPVVLTELQRRIDQLTSELTETATLLASANGSDHYRLVHREYVLDRERLELMLSHELNTRRLLTTDEVSIPDKPDPVIADLGQRLNDLRVKRRIFDYVVQALA